MPLNFDDSFKTGMTDIDNQHEFIFDAVKHLDINNCKDNIIFALCVIQEYINTHFQKEEELMIKYKYPDLEEHVQQHREFLEKYTALKQKFEEKEDITQEYLQNLRDFLNEWFTMHYTDIDLKMVNFIKKEI